MKKYFVCSDIHSFYYEWRDALDKQGFEIDNKDHIVCICGDLFDRGPQSKECLEFAKDMKAQGRLIYVRGNHEDLLFDCYYQIIQGKNIDSHHNSNGTIDTICQLSDTNKYDVYLGVDKNSNIVKVKEALEPVLDFITDTCVDYYEFEKYILVHGYIPTISERGIPAYWRKGRGYAYKEDWRNGDLYDWELARWVNGVELAEKYKIYEPDKQIVVGHWHCSYGWSWIKQERKEFPEKNRKNWQKSFEIFETERVIAIDSCCAYTGFINCYVIEE